MFDNICCIIKKKKQKSFKTLTAVMKYKILLNQEVVLIFKLNFRWPTLK